MKALPCRPRVANIHHRDACVNGVWSWMHSVHCCAGAFTRLRQRPRKWVAWVQVHRVVFFFLGFLVLLLADIPSTRSLPGKFIYLASLSLVLDTRSVVFKPSLLLAVLGALCAGAAGKSTRSIVNHGTRLFFVTPNNPISRTSEHRGCEKRVALPAWF